MDSSANNRFVTFTHGLAFVLGFSAVFILFGVAASTIGRFLGNAQDTITRVGGILIVILGLHMTGILRVPVLDYDTRIQQSPDRKLGYFSSALMGIFFSAGWSPCVGPVLGAILTFALNGGSISTGIALLSAYSAGLAIPFLLAALGIGWITVVLKKYSKVMHYVEVTMGVVLVIVGYMLNSGTFALIAQQSQFFYYDFGL
jgi:cytochrome c-type biogenesis protein